MGISANRAATLRLVGAALAEPHDKWAGGRHYVTFTNHQHDPALPISNILEASA